MQARGGGGRYIRVSGSLRPLRPSLQKAPSPQFPQSNLKTHTPSKTVEWTVRWGRPWHQGAGVEYHLRIIFEHSRFQNINFQSQNRCMKELTNLFSEKYVPQSFRLAGGKIPVENASWQGRLLECNTVMSQWFPGVKTLDDWEYRWWKVWGIASQMTSQLKRKYF